MNPAAAIIIFFIGTLFAIAGVAASLGVDAATAAIGFTIQLAVLAAVVRR